MRTLRAKEVEAVRSYDIGEYEQSMSAIHDEVARTGEPVAITKDGKPYVSVVPSDVETPEEAVLAKMVAEGLVSPPVAKRPRIDPVDLGGDDTTRIISENRR